MLLSRFRDPEPKSKSCLVEEFENKRAERDLLQDKLNEMDAVLEEMQDEINHT
ncbi:hypothetical protein ACFP7A_01370 [Sporolactobacillus kofuensis]|uniref:Uncharacterized protein n=1 Tax=Sporolactobacillus kofuensis TaxID=269672 RepID=A0ABW1WA39_9BACL|nr:hypothetical protein [Sporolactobacillus kofuensis]MCO7177046.1 hypothetical protein [Sporolactobacillus kofuensis]